MRRWPAPWRRGAARPPAPPGAPPHGGAPRGCRPHRPPGCSCSPRSPPACCSASTRSPTPCCWPSPTPAPWNPDRSPAPTTSPGWPRTTGSGWRCATARCTCWAWSRRWCCCRCCWPCWCGTAAPASGCSAPCSTPR
ncbi:hypothetical protein ACFQXA_03805 [Nocardiopsis composta]